MDGKAANLFVVGATLTGVPCSSVRTSLKSVWPLVPFVAVAVFTAANACVLFGSLEFLC